MGSMKSKIGHLVQRFVGLESVLRLHGILVERSLGPEWRFKGKWVTTGPFETLMGYRSCGASSGDVTWCDLYISPLHGEISAFKKIQVLILTALCEYPGLADLNEDVPVKEGLHGDEFDQLRCYDNGRTRRPLNHSHKRARKVRGVGLVCRSSGVYLTGRVVLGSSSWGLFWLAVEDEPKWNTRFHLDTWLGEAVKRLDLLVNRWPIEERDSDGVG